MVIATRSPKMCSVFTKIHHGKRKKVLHCFSHVSLSLCRTPAILEQTSCASHPRPAGSVGPAQDPPAASLYTRWCHTQTAPPGSTKNKSWFRHNWEDPDPTKATANSLVVPCVLPAITDDLMSLFSDSFLILNHVIDPTKVPWVPESARTWLTFTPYANSGIFCSLLFLFLNFKRRKLGPYSNHGCLKSNRMLLSGSTLTLTVGKSRKPGEGEIGRHTTAAGTLRPHNTAADGCHQQILTFLLHQGLSGVAECDSIIRSRFGLILSNNCHHTQHVIVSRINVEGNVSLKGRWIYPHVFLWAATEVCQFQL